MGAFDGFKVSEIKLQYFGCTYAPTLCSTHIFWLCLQSFITHLAFVYKHEILLNRSRNYCIYNLEALVIVSSELDSGADLLYCD